jgi:hypothetical protein
MEINLSSIAVASSAGLCEINTTIPRYATAIPIKV